MIEIQRIKVGNVEMYESPRFIPQLRAFVSIGAGYELGEIIDASATEKRALVLILGDACPCWYPYSVLHCIHTYHPHTHKVEIHGEPS